MVSKKLIFFFGISILNLLLVVLFKQLYLDLVLQSMPFRELYNPTLITPFFYLMPFLLGWMLAKDPNISFSNCFVFSLIFTIPNIIFILGYLTPLQYITQAYLVFFNISIILVGFIFSRKPILKEQIDPEKNSPKWILLFVLTLIIVICINLVPVILSDYVVGSDIHYHLALTVGQKELWQHPYLFEEKSSYPPLVYDIIKTTTKVFPFNSQDLWRIFYPQLTIVFLVLLFGFVVTITNNYKVAFFTNLFVLPWSQLILTDISTRLFGWILMIASLLIFAMFIKYKKKVLIIPLILLIITLYLTHTVVLIALIIVLIVYFFLNFNWRSKIPQFIFKSSSFSDDDKFVYLIYIFFALGLLLIYSYINKTNIGSILLFNEIPISLFYPWGIISFLILPLGIIGIFNTIKNQSWENNLKISILFLITNSLAYFFLTWDIHARYFSEFGFLIFTVLSGEVFVKILPKNPKTRILLIFGLILIIGISIAPRYDFMINYAERNQNQINGYESILKGIREYTSEDSVILVNPEDILNRFIPSLTGRYIFGARGELVEKSEQWVVIPGCIIPGKENICTERYNLSKDFFDSPTEKKLKNIKDKYKLDFVVIRNNQDNKEKFVSLFGVKVYSDSKFELYRVD